MDGMGGGGRLRFRKMNKSDSVQQKENGGDGRAWVQDRWKMESDVSMTKIASI